MIRRTAQTESLCYNNEVFSIRNGIILLGNINKSYADLEIDSLDVYPTLDSYDRFSMFVYVQTSEPYHGIDYYLDGTWIARAYGNGTRTVDYLWYDENDFGGELTGTKHTLKLSVMQSAGDDIVVTKPFFVFKPIEESRTTQERQGKKPRYPSVSGSVTLYEQSYDGTHITIDAEAYAQNASGAEDSVEMYGVFRHTILNKSFDELETYMPGRDVKPGDSYGPYYSGRLSYSCSNIPDGQTWNSNAYIRLRLHDTNGIDDYYIDKTVYFDESYNLDNK